MLKEVSELIVTADMHERKRIMFERSDAFVALPGGIGTLEEVIEVMTWAQLEQHEKPVLIVNINGFWDPLVALFAQMTREGFLHKEFLGDHIDLPVRFCDTAEAVVPTLAGGHRGCAAAGTRRHPRRKGDVRGDTARRSSLDNHCKNDIYVRR